jgi:DNA polymerase-4
MDRAIIHLNITDFAVAVERIKDSSLQRLPLIVATGAASQKRSLVLDMSEEAYGDGVRKGMSIHSARKYCGLARVVAPRPMLYRRAMAALVKQVCHYTPLVEQGQEDGHLFLDVTGTHRLFGPAPDVALRLRREMRQTLGLNPVWSLASSKLVAKVASRMVRPFGEYIVEVGEEDAFLAPLPLTMLPGLSSEEMTILRDFNVQQIGQLADLSCQQLQVPFRKRGSYLSHVSQGRDGDVVGPLQSGGKELSVEHAFAEDTADKNEIHDVVGQLVQRLGRQLRHSGMLGQRVGISLVSDDGKVARKYASHKGGSNNDFVLRSLAREALLRAMKRRVRMRSCVLSCDRLVPCSRQQTLFCMQSSREERQGKILAAMDQVCKRFGEQGIRLGAGL